MKRTFIPTTALAPAVIVPPAFAALGAAAWSAANRAVFLRFQVTVPTVVRYVNWSVGTASGNVQVGIVQLTGSGRTSYTRIAHTGVITCPTAGNVRTDLGATTLTAGDYAVFLWADNTTFQARVASNSAIAANRISATVSSIGSGVGTSGTITFDQYYWAVSVEGDV